MGGGFRGDGFVELADGSSGEEESVVGGRMS